MATSDADGGFDIFHSEAQLTPMTITRAFIAIASTVGVCTICGIGIGAALGYWCPNYYRTVLPVRSEAHFDPVQIGIGFGLNAGVFSGVLIGFVVVAVVAYCDLRVRLAQIRQGELHSWDPDKG